MNGIPMAETSGTEQSTVVVNGCPANADLVFAILVHIAHRYAVHALPIGRRALAFVGYLTLGIANCPPILLARVKPSGA